MAVAERVMDAAVDALFVLTVLGTAIPVAARLPSRARTVLIVWLVALGLLAGAGVFVRPRAVLVWNLAGIAILANIVMHAFFSAPTPFQLLRTEPPTTIIATLPYIWLPGFLVPLALSLHVASLRALGVGTTPVKEM